MAILVYSKFLYDAGTYKPAWLVWLQLNFQDNSILPNSPVRFENLPQVQPKSLFTHQFPQL
jgi:hypothetical protein